MAEEMIVKSVSEDLGEKSISTYCSVQGGDRATKARVYNAMNNPEHKVGDYINQTILVKDVLVEQIELANEETGELQPCMRVVLLDAEGEAYQAVSTGIYNAVKNAIQIFGAPTWDEPLPCKIKQVKVGRGSMLTFDIDL